MRIFNMIEPQVDEYLKEKGSDLEQEIAADIILQILDVMLKSEFSLNSQLVSISVWGTISRFQMVDYK